MSTNRTAGPEVTPEVIGDFQRSPTMRLVVGLFAFVALANVAAYLLLEWRPINRGNWLVREKWRLLDRSSPVETLVLGDSSCNQGVRPDVLDARLATRSLNLCTVGNLLAINDAWMLGEYIEKHGAPKRVIIVHVYDMWTRTEDYTFRRLVAKIPRPWGFWNDMDPPLALGVSELEDIVSSRWLPLHAENASVLSWLRAPGRASGTRFAIDERGFMTVTEAAPHRVTENMRKHLRDLESTAPWPSEPNRLALRRLDELAKRHGIEITVALAPMFTELWAQPALREHVDRLRTAIRETLGPTSPVRVIDGAPRTFAAAQLENVDHVVGDAAREYTEWLASHITTRSMRP